MRLFTILLVLGCTVSQLPGQWVETTVLLPDSTSGLTSIGSLVFHSPTNTVYVGGEESFLVAVNALTNTGLSRVAVGRGPHVLCSDPGGNKVYCADRDWRVTVIDGATGQPVETIPVTYAPDALCYSRQERKLYCGAASDSFIRVIDCVSDSLVAQVRVGCGSDALCYNPRLNRIYCAHRDRDDVTVIDCAADTVIGAIWVHGVEPWDICYDSATNCVYTANNVSSSVSVIDCTGDTLARLIPVGHGPVAIVAGPPGKVYCANYNDSSVSAISDSGVRTVLVGRRPFALSCDAENGRVYCAREYRDSVVVIDATPDTVVAEVGTGSSPRTLCYNPSGNNTYVACGGDGVISAIGGVSDTVEAVIPVGASRPGPLCYSTTNNHLYCLDDTQGLLFVIDGVSNQVLKILKAPSTGSYDTLIWNPISNKVYFTNSHDVTVSILDCASDSIVATLQTGVSPRALCSSDDGKVYVANEGGGVAVIDGSGDSILAIVPISDHPLSLCYDRTDNKVYVGKHYSEEGGVSVIDADGDSVMATIPLRQGRAAVCWNQNHDKVYVVDANRDSLAVIDCASDTVVRNIPATYALFGPYCDSVSDRVYCVDGYHTRLRVINAATDTFYPSLNLGSISALLDNGKPGPANRLYCADWSGGVTVVKSYKTDSVMRRINVGAEPVALAWNPLHSCMYVSNSGSSSITVIRDSLPAGVEEVQPQVPSRKLRATVVRGVLFLPRDMTETSEVSDRVPRHALLDISGRKVLDLKPGANDVRALAPGVYFVRAVGRKLSAVSCSKVVITR